MGEEESRIFVTGAPGLDGLSELGEMPREQCLQALGLAAGSEFILTAFHPVVQQASQAAQQTCDLLEVLRRIGLPVLWAEPNADAGSLEILRVLDAQGLPPGSRRVKHLGRHQFAAAMRHCAAMVGNSSAGIIEAASFGTPVVNVGNRQRLREHGANVIDVLAHASTIEQALRAQLAHGRWPCENAWGDGQTAPRIAHLLATLPLDGPLLEKINTY